MCAAAILRWNAYSGQETDEKSKNGVHACCSLFLNKKFVPIWRTSRLTQMKPDTICLFATFTIWYPPNPASGGWNVELGTLACERRGGGRATILLSVENCISLSIYPRSGELIWPNLLNKLPKSIRVMTNRHVPPLCACVCSWFVIEIDGRKVLLNSWPMFSQSSAGQSLAAITVGGINSAERDIHKMHRI